ncbi:hypothetical protein [Sphaerobacter sp.]|uniref:hypothetical protein n=1 Tax=Sphaerobacter sp. TaxID=2099654 RepID=UPI001D2FB5E7|nr:hypothetical protein [Sphaerobacter sp.]MBX5444607.1 cell division protein FtsL [Sphaerobacter sp.]
MSTVTRVGRAQAVRRERRRYVSLNGAALVIVAGVAVSVIGILYLIQTSHVASLGYELSRIERERNELAMENARLGYLVAEQESLEQVERVATQELGMRPLTRYRFLEVQAPAEEELPPPPTPTPDAETLWERVWRGLTGVGRAQAPATGSPALPGLGGGR